MSSDNLNESEIRKIKFHPSLNEDAISIIKRPDGNYRGFMMKHGVLLQTRQSDPMYCLQDLLTKSEKKDELAEERAEAAQQEREDNAEE